MNNLDDVGAMKAKDPKGVLASTGLFPDQCQQAWDESSAKIIPEEYKKVKKYYRLWHGWLKIYS